ncbi:Linear+gramicidin+synthase+subunit+B [Methylocapsa aurea]|uniref:amino acid adenylation domain-containing protein n=1 Tax=Methylocapsa aurea TaxID=663610 RepID=UPI003D18E447
MDILPQDERHRLLVEWNDTATDDPQDRLLHEMFEAQAARDPEAVALVYEGAQLSYGELNERANRLAHHLQTLGVGPDVIVGLCVERSFEMIVALLGVLKAGGAYLPIDPDYPRDRIAYMIADAAPALVLTQEHLRERLPETITTLRLDADWSVVAEESAANPAPRAASQNLAYVIYTSGSTGRPKGVGVSHDAIACRLEWMQERFGLTVDDIVLQKTPYGFDVSVWEFFWPLRQGARMSLAPPGSHRSPEQLMAIIDADLITTLHFVPSMLRAFLDAPKLETLSSLRRVLCGGEALAPDLRDRFIASYAAELHHLYGPTEASIDAAVHRCDPDQSHPLVPIGRPISNTQIYLLGPGSEPVPIGVAGELHIGGAGLARGYLGRPDLTAERFVPNPFGRAGERLYRTGDLARYRADGNIEFLGRIDHQVKIRGFRIELGEIEAALTRLPQLREAVVIASEDGRGDKRLVAYVVAAEGAALEIAELRGALARELPDYMIPAAFVALDALPLTPNGKIDRRALPALDLDAQIAHRYVAPRNATEEALCRIFADVLGIDRVGVDDDFFQLGGHSLLAVQIVSRIWRALERQAPLRSLFAAPRIADLAAQIEGEVGEAALPAILSASRSAPLPLSFAQQRLWFLDQLQPGDAAYNIPAALRVIGDFDTLAFAFAVNEIVRRHDVLRTAFVLRDGAATQVIAPRLEIETPIIDLGALDEQMRETEALRLAAEEARRPFDLATGPLLRVKTLDLGVRPATAERERVVLFTMHHIVSDGWSSGVLLREFVALYEARLAGRPSPLPELAIQYADYAVWQRDWLQGEVLDRQLAYWRDKLGGAPPALDLPTDHPRPPRQDHAGARLSFTIAKHVADRLAALGREEGATLFMTLLAAFQLLLSRYSGQRDISVGAPVANRRRLELEQLIGFFVNTLVMRTDLSGDPSFRVLLARVRETALGAQAHQDLPFERLVEDLRPVRDMSRDPLFQVWFVLTNALQAEISMRSTLRTTLFVSDSESAHFDLTLSVVETENGLSGSLNYATALFEERTIDRMAQHYCALLDGIARDPDRRIGELDILPQDERHRLLVEWNDTATDYPQDRLLHELFEAQAARAPEAVALVYEGAQLSYGELNERANRLAHHLRTLGVGPDVIVGLCVERSFEMIVALLGALKAGGAYLPIDPDYPKDRIAYMIADAAPALVLTQEHLRERLPETITTLRLDADWSVVAQESAANPASRAASQNLAYVIYTSGSTGKPKGVAVIHSGVANYAQSIKRTDRRSERAALRPRFDAGRRSRQYEPVRLHHKRRLPASLRQGNDCRRSCDERLSRAE